MPAPRDPLAKLSMAEIERRLGVMGAIHPVKLTQRDKRMTQRLKYYQRHQREGA